MQTSIKDIQTTNYSELPEITPEMISSNGWENPWNAFDKNSSSYARANNTAQYVQIDFGREVVLTDFYGRGIQINSAAVGSGMLMYIVNEDNTETQIANFRVCWYVNGGSTGEYYFGGMLGTDRQGIKCRKVRLYQTETYKNAPARWYYLDFYGYCKETLSSATTYSLREQVAYGLSTPQDTFLKQGSNLGLHTKVGNPTIQDGVVSGFSSANYMQLPFTLRLSNAKSWEMGCKFEYIPGSYDQPILGESSSAGWVTYIGIAKETSS